MAEHAEWEARPFVSCFATDYASVTTIADLFRQMSFDERMHKEASTGAIHNARFK